MMVDKLYIDILKVYYNSTRFNLLIGIASYKAWNTTLLNVR